MSNDFDDFTASDCPKNPREFRCDKIFNLFLTVCAFGLICNLKKYLSTIDYLQEFIDNEK